MVKVIGIVALVVCLQFNIQGQNLKFDKLRVEDGLTSINAMLIDQYGFTWFGGTHGLYRYDGTEIISYHHDPNDSTTLSSDNIISLHEDDAGNIWIGTEGKGLNVYRADLEIVERIRLSNYPIDGLSISALCSIKDLLWVGTKGRGIYVIDPGLNVVDHLYYDGNKESRISNNDVFDIRVGHGDVWVTTNKGILDRFVGNRVEHIEYREGDLNGVRTGQRIAISPGKAWIGTEGQGLYVYDLENGLMDDSLVPGKFDSYAITDLSADSKGGVWFSTDGDGAIYFDPLNETFDQFFYDQLDEFSLSNNASYSLIIDALDRVWLGMGDGVVNISSHSSMSYIRPNHGLGFRVVVDINIDGNNLWAATGGGGVTKIDLLSGNAKTYNSHNRSMISSDIVLCISGDGDGGAWFGTFLGGLYHIDKNERITRYTVNDGLSSDHVFDIEVDQDKVWIATQGGGINSIDLATGQILVFNRDNSGLASNRIQTIYLASNVLWIGHYSEGVQVFDVVENKLIDPSIEIPSRTLESVKEYPVHDITIDSNGWVWIATGGGGLFKITGERTSQTYTRDNGLPSNSVYGIYCQADTTYVGTNRGIGIINDATGDVLSIDKDFGLLTADFESGAIAFYNDEAFFSSKEGILRFIPPGITNSKDDILPIFTEVKVMGRSIKPGEEVEGVVALNESVVNSEGLTLPYSQNNFSIHFSVPGFANTSLTEFRYRMRGLDEEWIQIPGGARFIPFSDLNDGEYSVELQAKGVGGEWLQASSLGVVIIHPVYRSTWAYILYGLILMAMSFGAYLLVRWRIAMQNQLKFEKYSREKDNELNNQKFNFFTGVSHELRTPLTLLVGPLEQLAKNPKLDNRARNRVMGMQRNANRLVLLINQLLDFRKMETGKMRLQVSQQDLLQFLEEILLTFRELALQKGIQLELINNLKRRSQYFDETKIEIILYNLLSNALKFTEKSGKVSVELNETERMFEMIVSDTGKGISKENVSRIFDPFFRDRTIDKNEKGSGIGLTLVRNVVELHHGDITVDSEVLKGTAFKIRIPGEKDSYPGDELLKQSKEMNENDEVSEIVAGPGGSTGEVKSSLLIVEDNKEIQNFLYDNLNLEFDIFIANNGKEGLELSQEIVPDIVLSDVMMPEMDGIEMCRHLKTDISTSHIPIILLTARSGFTHELLGLDTGADDYIIKPFQVELLRIRLNNLLDNRRKLRDKLRKELILEPSEVAVSDPDEEFLRKLMNIIENHITDSEFTVKDLAKEMGLSHSVLYRKIMALTNLTINDFIKNVRLKRAAQLLQSNAHRINEVSYLVGFTSPKYFSTCFREHFGTTPKEYSGQGEKVD